MKIRILLMKGKEVLKCSDRYYDEEDEAAHDFNLLDDVLQIPLAPL